MDMLNSYDAGTAPMETFYDGYVVNAIMDAAYRSIEIEEVGAGAVGSVARLGGNRRESGHD